MPDCWEKGISLLPLVFVTTNHLEQIANAIDLINLLFRDELKHGNMIPIYKAGTLSGLAKSCHSAPEFAAGLAAINSLIKTMRFAELLPENNGGSIIALGDYLQENFPGQGADVLQLLNALRIIRTVAQHHKSRYDAKALTAFAALDIVVPIYNWENAWRRCSARISKP